MIIEAPYDTAVAVPHKFLSNEVASDSSPKPVPGQAFPWRGPVPFREKELGIGAPGPASGLLERGYRERYRYRCGCRYRCRCRYRYKEGSGQFRAGRLVSFLGLSLGAWRYSFRPPIRQEAVHSSRPYYKLYPGIQTLPHWRTSSLLEGPPGGPAEVVLQTLGLLLFGEIMYSSPSLGAETLHIN